jgi:hypothetical protein
MAVSSGGFEYSPMSNAPSSAGSSGGGGGIFATMSIMSSINQIVGSIYQGRIASAQAKYNAAIQEGRDKWLQLQQEVSDRQYQRFLGRTISKSFVNIAGAGLAASGSPIAVMVDTATQINIDKSIAHFNIEQDKIATRNSAEMYRTEGKNAVRASYANAFSALLQGGEKYAAYKGGYLDLSQGAKSAGRQS